MQRSLSSFTTAMFVSNDLCTLCRSRGRYEINKCYHSDPEFRGKPCGILIHQQWEQNGRPNHLSCKHMEART